jgi:pimeloyl-[acyl-carrier protein] methyl ester esterase
MTELHVELTGAGRDLVLLHGWGMHGGVWAGVVPDLARHHRVHAVDLPGYGDSAAITPYSLDSIAQRLADVLPAQFDVCGWSLGGQVALTLAARYPARVRRLATVGCNPCFATRADWPLGISSEVLQLFADSLAQDYAGTLKRFLALQVQGEASARAVLTQLRALLFARGQPSDAVLKAGLAILLQADLRPLLGGIKQPTLVLHGAQDTLAPLAAGMWLADVLPNGRLHAVPGASHAPFLSHSADFTAVLTGFLHG